MSFVYRYIGLIVAILPCFTGLVRFRRLGKTYQPLLLMFFAGLLSEVISEYLIYYKRTSNAGVANTYALVEWILVFWQFRMWGFFRNRKRIGYVILFAPCLVWVAENLVFGRMINFSPYFRIFASFTIVLFSVNKINFMITHDNRKLLGHPDFLFCIAFIIYFIYDIVYEWAYQSSSNAAPIGITETIIFLWNYINALTNIIFAIAFLRVPAARKIELW